LIEGNHGKRFWRLVEGLDRNYREKERLLAGYRIKLKDFSKKVKEIEKEINGRIFIRYSGTEPLLRILIEADKDIEYLKKLSDEIFSYYQKCSTKEVL
jgi:phosphomannomutase